MFLVILISFLIMYIYINICIYLVHYAFVYYMRSYDAILFYITVHCILLSCLVLSTPSHTPWMDACFCFCALSLTLARLGPPGQGLPESMDLGRSGRAPSGGRVRMIIIAISNANYMHTWLKLG